MDQVKIKTLLDQVMNALLDQVKNNIKAIMDKVEFKTIMD